jgi:hypothetical protein
MREDTVTRQIKEEFASAELVEMGKKLAGKMADLETVASDKKAADATFNERKQVLASEAETLYRQINKGYEMAQIGCDIRYNDPAPGQKSFYRMDTSAHVETVEMTWEEKQEEIQFNLIAPIEGQPQPSDEQVNEALDGIPDTELPPPPTSEKPPDEATDAAGAND